MSSPSPFLRPMHPKTGISPRPEAMKRILDLGWVAQLKIHGHRAQIHISDDADVELAVYNRHGKRHRMEMPEPMVREVRRLFTPERGWNVIDAEWLKPEKKLFVFDFLRKDGKLLRAMTYPQRHALLPRLYLSPFIATLPLIRDLDGCLAALKQRDAHIEGLVFKSLKTTGFVDTAILRCRRSAAD